MTMRIVIACGVLAAFVAGASAQTPAPSGPAKPAPMVPAKPVPATVPDKTTGPSKNVKALNEQAQRESQAREKRWDDRMRRVTRSMCDRC